MKILVMLLITCMNELYSQINQEWTARYSNGIDGATSITVDQLGNVYVTGGISTGTISDLATIKYSASGNQIWVAMYNGPGNNTDFANTIIIDNSGDVIVTGVSEGIGTGYDIITIKYNPLGVQQWVSRYTSIGNKLDAGYAISIDNSNNIYVAGESYDNSLLHRDYCTIKYSSSGAEQWVRRYHDGVAYSIAVDDSNNVIVTGRGAGDFATVKYNSSGVQKWASIFNGPLNGDDEGNSIGIDSLGNAYVCGSTEGALFYSDYATVKYNSAGIEQWYRVYKGSANFLDLPKAIKVDRKGNAFVTGYSTESGNGYDMTTIKYNTNGDSIWKARYNNGLNDIAYAITLDNGGNVYITGESDGNGTNGDYATVKYDSSGQQQWVKRYDFTGQYSDVATSITVDNSGSLYVTGSSDRDFLTIKYSQQTGIDPLMLESPTEFKLFQNYPNPFNPKTVISYQLSMFNFVSLKVYDVLGNEVTKLVNQKQNTGNYSVTFDGSNLSSGIFFYRLEVDGNIIDTKRMILLK